MPMAFVVRRELMAHKARTNRDGPDLVFGRTKTEAFFASTIRARANKAWTQAGLEPITPHEARHCAISYFIAAGLDWKQISTWAGHGDVRQTWNRYGHLVPGGEEQARGRLDAYLNPPKPTPTVAHTVAQDPQNAETPVNTGVLKYRYRDSNCVAHPVSPVFIGVFGSISPVGGCWGQPETGHAAPKMPPVLPPVSRPDLRRPETHVEALLGRRCSGRRIRPARILLDAAGQDLQRRSRPLPHPRWRLPCYG